uniref:Uncharacterized protein n=1 Tax=Arundo donax TaxID=35708 RepID=A0A0A9FWB7_ARUDO
MAVCHVAEVAVLRSTIVVAVHQCSTIFSMAGATHLTDTWWSALVDVRALTNDCLGLNYVHMLQPACK